MTPNNHHNDNDDNEHDDNINDFIEKDDGPIKLSLVIESIYHDNECC